MTYAGDVIEMLDQLGIPKAIFIGTSLGGLVTMAVAVIDPDRIVAAVLNDVGPDVDPSGIDRILTYVGKDVRYKSWDEAGEAVSKNYGASFDRYTHEDWVKMVQRNCREEDGEIRFDYDMAIAEPFKNGGATPAVDLWPFFAALAQKPLVVVRGEHSDLLTADTLARMRTVAPAMTPAVVGGVGHAPELNEPEATSAIDALLNSLYP